MRQGVRMLLVGGALIGGPAATAEDAAAYCRRVGTDATVRPLPAELVPAFIDAFRLTMPAGPAQRSGVMRCANGAVLACFVGANLPCDKADTRRSLPAADAWCRENHDPAVIPAYVTGHSSIYAWHCAGGRAVAGDGTPVDAQGFIERDWKRLP